MFPYFSISMAVGMLGDVVYCYKRGAPVPWASTQRRNIRHVWNNKCYSLLPFDILKYNINSELLSNILLC